MSEESGHFVELPFHTCNTWRLSVSDLLSPTRDTLFGLERPEGRTCCKKYAAIVIGVLSFSPEIKQLLIYKKSQKVISPISTIFTVGHLGPI